MLGEGWEFVTSEFALPKLNLEKRLFLNLFYKLENNDDEPPPLSLFIASPGGL